jgi:hypothetical protein
MVSASLGHLSFEATLDVATRIGIQGVEMNAAITPTDVAAAFAAYVPGNVASNLFGRLMSAALTDHLGPRR